MVIDSEKIGKEQKAVEDQATQNRAAARNWVTAEAGAILKLSPPRRAG